MLKARTLCSLVNVSLWDVIWSNFFDRVNHDILIDRFGVSA